LFDLIIVYNKKNMWCICFVF